MVRTLITPKAHRRYHARFATGIATVLAIGLSGIGHGVAAERSITLHQGSNITVTAPAAFNRMAFDLAGQIWLQGTANEPAVSLPLSGTLHRRPAFSRDGRLVAYESLQSGYRQIFVTTVDSGVTRQVTFGPYDHLAPAWSPVGFPRSRLVISSNRAGTYAIWEVDIDNLELRQLTFTADNEYDPAWNDDGSQLAYVTESAQGSSLYILSPGAKPHRVLHERTRLAAPAWRPGGGLLTYTRLSEHGSQLRMLLLSTPPITKPITQQEQVSPRPAHWLDRSNFLYAADGKIRRRALGLSTFAEVPFNVTIRINRDPRAARDTSFAGRENQPVRGSDGRTERADGRVVISALSDLWEFQHARDGTLTLVRQLTNDAAVDAQPAFSPDGQQLAFISDRSGSRQVWIMDHASLDMRRLTRDDTVIGSPAWSPDGTAVAYVVVNNDHDYRLRLADISSGRVHTLPATSRERGTPVFADRAWSIDAGPDAPHGASAGNRQPIPLNWRPASAGERYIVRAGRIFDGIGPGYFNHQEIVIERDLIIAIRPWSHAVPDTPVIDATAQTVIPGLIDLAVQQEPVNDERTGRKWLAAGVTTIRMTIGQTETDFDRALERYESWSSGRRSGPRLMITVRPCHGVSGLFDAPLFARAIENAAVLDIVAVELCPALSGQRLTDVIRHAHQHGLSVIAAAPLPGMMPGADELRIEALLSSGDSRPGPVDWRDYLLVTTTTGIPSRLVTAARPGYRILDGLNPSWQYQKIFTAAERRRFNESWYFDRAPHHVAPTVDPNRILGAGGSIILGSEAPVTPQGLGLHVEMRRLAASSVQPFQILKMASLDAARVLGMGESLGLVRVGRQADLVILDGDPLADIDATVNVVGTIVNGRYHSRKDLTIPGLRGHTRTGRKIQP